MQEKTKSNISYARKDTLENGTFYARKNTLKTPHPMQEKIH